MKRCTSNRAPRFCRLPLPSLNPPTTNSCWSRALIFQPIGGPLPGLINAVFALSHNPLHPFLLRHLGKLLTMPFHIRSQLDSRHLRDDFELVAAVVPERVRR
jgi:hypothetical protein